MSETSETRRLPTGALGAEPLVPLRRQAVQRYEWLRRNTTTPPEDLVVQIAAELKVRVTLVRDALGVGGS